MTQEEQAELEQQVERANDAAALANFKPWQRIQTYLREYADRQTRSFVHCVSWEAVCELRGLVKNANDMATLTETLIEIGKRADAELKESK